MKLPPSSLLSQDLRSALPAELSAGPSPACSPGSNTGTAASTAHLIWFFTGGCLHPHTHTCPPSASLGIPVLPQPLTQPGAASSDPVHPGAPHAAPRTRSQAFVCVWLGDAEQTHSEAPPVPRLPRMSSQDVFPRQSVPADSTGPRTHTVLAAKPGLLCVCIHRAEGEPLEQPGPCSC